MYLKEVYSMKINETDLVFYGSTLVGLATLFTKLAVGVVPGNVLTWIGIITTLVGYASYALYEKINGNTPPPTPPV
jgi:hypothetical protein